MRFSFKKVQETLKSMNFECALIEVEDNEVKFLGQQFSQSGEFEDYESYTLEEVGSCANCLGIDISHQY